jgi:hypothetical protein
MHDSSSTNHKPKWHFKLLIKHAYNMYTHKAMQRNAVRISTTEITPHAIQLVELLSVHDHQARL